METLLHPFQDDVLQKVGVDEINTFCEMSLTNVNSLLHPDLDALVKSNSAVPPAAIEKAKSEISRVSTVFSEEQMVTGSLILKAFAREMHFGQKDAIFFARSALNAWPRGVFSRKESGAGQGKLMLTDLLSRSMSHG